MDFVDFDASFDFDAAEADLNSREQQDVDKREKDKKNSDFFMVFKTKGAPAMRGLLSEPRGAKAAALFLFIAEAMDHSNALVASNKALAQKLEMSEASISRAIALLEARRFIVRLKSGSTNIFSANPEIVWSSHQNKKQYALFSNAKILIAQDEQAATGIRRFNTVYAKTKASNSNPAGAKD